MKFIILHRRRNVDYKTGVIIGFARKLFLKVGRWSYKYQFEMDF